MRKKPLASVATREAVLNLKLIYEKEPEAFNAIAEVIKHVSGTYGDKYQSDVTEYVDTKQLLLGKDGKFPNLHCALKYVQRYSTVGFEKSEQPIDLKKAIHYLLFELQRKNKKS